MKQRIRTNSHLIAMPLDQLLEPVTGRFQYEFAPSQYNPRIFWEWSVDTRLFFLFYTAKARIRTKIDRKAAPAKNLTTSQLDANSCEFVVKTRKATSKPSTGLCRRTAPLFDFLHL
jgi:hypothetical protein